MRRQMEQGDGGPLAARRRRIALRVLVLGVAAAMGTAALVSASVPRTFKTGDTLTAADLNDNFTALDGRLSKVEVQEPFGGTYPAVLGLGIGPHFCGTPPPTLNLSSAAPPSNFIASSAFGNVVFTNGGVFSLDLSPVAVTCPTGNLCAAPVTFFLRSPRVQTIIVTNYVDDAGAVYVDGNLVASNLGANNRTSVNVPAGDFALSFLACSTNGASLWMNVQDPFLTSADYGLTVDYDRVFHRNGR
jgi:hypothetical protein